MERVLRKLDSTTLAFSKLEAGRIDIFGTGVGDDHNPHQIVGPDQVFEARLQDGQIALVLKAKGSPAGSEEAQGCLEQLVTCDLLGGKHKDESYPAYLTRIIDTLTSAVAYGASANTAVLEEPRRLHLTSTHTYVIMDVTAATYFEINAKMRAAGYDHAFGDMGEIDMHGIAVMLDVVQEISPRPTVCPGCGVDVMHADHRPDCSEVHRLDHGMQLRNPTTSAVKKALELNTSDDAIRRAAAVLGLKHEELPTDMAPNETAAGSGGLGVPGSAGMSPGNVPDVLDHGPIGFSGYQDLPSGSGVVRATSQPPRHANDCEQDEGA